MKTDYVKIKWGAFEYQGDISHLEAVIKAIVPLGVRVEDISEDTQDGYE